MSTVGKVNSDIFAAMNGGGKPYRTYIKTILGKVYVTILNMITGTPTPEGVILSGDPRKKDPGAMIDVWSEQEDYFFKKTNKSHFARGILIPYTSAEEVAPVKTIEQATDEELTKIVNSKYFSLVSELNKIESVAVLFRMKNIAEENEKSSKILEAIEARIYEVQLASYTPKTDDTAEQEE